MGTTTDRCDAAAGEDAAGTGAAGVDVTGDGCVDEVAVGTVDAAGRPVVRVGDRQWLVGRAGDLPAVGDWDCDGIGTPAVVRPASGEVFFFAVWPRAGPPVRPTAVAAVPIGALAAHAAPAGATAQRRCHDLVVVYAEQSLRVNPLRQPSAATEPATLAAAGGP